MRGSNSRVASSDHRRRAMPAIAVGLALLGCGAPDDGIGADANDSADADLSSQLSAESVAVIPADFTAASIVALDEDAVVLARAVVSGEAFCPDCVDLEPSECPDACSRTRLTVAVVDTTSGELGQEILVQQSFPKTYDHDVDQVELVRLGPNRVGLAWLDCDNSTCMGLFASRSCSARYTVIDLDAQTTGPVTTLYEDRFGDLQMVANSSLGQILALTGKSYGGFGAGTRAAILGEAGDEFMLPWTALGGIDALSPAAVATDDGFAVVVDDRRPDDPPPVEPCSSSCECAGSVQTDPELGGLYAFELSAEGGVRSDLVAIGTAQDGHLDGGHYHAREVLSVMALDGGLVIAAGQAIDMEAELFVGRGRAWSPPVRFDSPIPLWITVIGKGDKAAWLGSEPSGGPATMSRIVAGVSSSTEPTRGALTEPLDSHVFEGAPVVTETGVTTTFLLRGIFAEGGGWDSFDVVKVVASW
jgi:hypothetical protein